MRLIDLKRHCCTSSFMFIVELIMQVMKPRSSNGNIIPFIPLDVVEKIFLAVDTQTLFHCSFVCRDWNSLITSPDFISRNSEQALQSKNEVFLVKVCRYIDNSESDIDTDVTFHECYSLHWDNHRLSLFRRLKTPTIDGFKTGKVLGTINGLTCLVDHLHEQFVLWNPTIRKYVMLPQLSMTCCEVHRSSVGFGFDSTNNDFKVVSLIHRNLKLHIVCVFSYATWSWKFFTKRTHPLPRCRVFKVAAPVFMNGILHWIAWNIDVGYQFILTFDLSHEVFGQIFLPERIAEFDGFVSIFTTGERLAVSKLVRGERQIYRKWYVWIMKQYRVYESWTNIVRSEERPYDRPNHKLIPKNVLGMRVNEDIIVEMGDGRILSYNPIARRTKSLQGVDALGVIKDRIFIRYHTESLYLLEKKDEVISY
ncbi:F-box/kelch-repeat protein At3g23880-like [Prosopis cineraria]|uniref:F-box/kelch-repeat protein At3g23880-like n=1 Tax=Prosopis cineraria TaxID=364024 RepID=UPI00240F8496|nr:F-box/kelch-repeat protein At3g23880-like [Prosopis cineraria]